LGDSNARNDYSFGEDFDSTLDTLGHTMKRKFAAMFFVVFMGNALAQESRVMSGRSGFDPSRADAAAKRNLEVSQWDEDMHLSVASVSLSFDDPMGNPEGAKDGDLCNVHRLRFRIVQIVDGSNFLASTTIDDSHVIYWFAGVSTKNISDGAVVRIVSPIVRDETKTYATILRSQKQVKKFRFQSPEEIKANEEKKQAERDKEKEAERQRWIDGLPSYDLAAGGVFRGSFIKLNKGKYQFRDSDRNIKEFSLSDFSDDSKKAVLKALKDSR